MCIYAFCKNKHLLLKLWKEILIRNLWTVMNKMNNIKSAVLLFKIDSFT